MIRTNVRIYICDQYIRIFEYSNIFVTLCYKPTINTGIINNNHGDRCVWQATIPPELIVQFSTVDICDGVEKSQVTQPNLLSGQVGTLPFHGIVKVGGSKIVTILNLQAHSIPKCWHTHHRAHDNFGTCHICWHSLLNRPKCQVTQKCWHTVYGNPMCAFNNNKIKAYNLF